MIEQNHTMFYEDKLLMQVPCSGINVCWIISAYVAVPELNSFSLRADLLGYAGKLSLSFL